jgi:hypothetical protein
MFIGRPMGMSEEMEKIIGRAVSDPAFRTKLIETPEAAVQEFGITISPSDLEQLQQLSVEQRTQAFEELATRKQKLTVVICGDW